MKITVDSNRNGNTGLRGYMGQPSLKKLGVRSTSHQNCLELFGVARPGKTARDRARKAS